MSNPNSIPGEPVAEPDVDGNVVDHAQEGLAYAEAASRDAVNPMTDTVDGADEIGTELRSDVNVPDDNARTQIITSQDPADAVRSLSDEPAAQQPIFVQAPEAPRPRGNRGTAGLVGLLAAIVFAALYLGANLLTGLVTGTLNGANVGATVLTALGSWSLWVPTAVFFLSFWLLGAIINRGRWASWVIWGLLVGFASWGGHLLGALFQAPFWQLTATQGQELVGSQMWTPLAFAAAIIGRELTIWFGAIVAARGKRVTELNMEARREYERTLEAGPQLRMS